MSRERVDDSDATARVARVAEAVRAEMRAARGAGPDGRALRIALTRAEAEGADVSSEPRASRGTWTLAAGATAVLAAAGIAAVALLPQQRTQSGAEASGVTAAAAPAAAPSPPAPRSPGVAGPMPEVSPARPTEHAATRRTAAVPAAPPPPLAVTRPTPPPRLFAARRGTPALAPAPPGDDLEAINGGALDHFARRWTRLAGDDAARLEADLLASVRGGDDFVEVPLPQLAGRGAAGAADAVRAYRQEREVVDPRLQRKVTLALKAASFDELCDELARQTGIPIAAGKRVADDNVTVFCKDRPARDLMRAVARLFGFAWDRKGAEGEWTYRLNQPLRAQLLEEELRSRDRNEALVALDQEMRRYEDHLDLTPAQARAAAKNATGPEKALLENLGAEGWAPARLYGALTPEQLSALHGGRGIAFDPKPAAPGERRSSGLPELAGVLDPSWAASIMDSFDNWRVSLPPGRGISINSGDGPEKAAGQPPARVAGLEPGGVVLRLQEKELGVLTLVGMSTFQRIGGGGSAARTVDLATGVSPSVRDPQNAETNAALRRAPGMAERVTLAPTAPENPAGRKDVVTAAEALEAVHKATGRDVLGDHFTRLHPLEKAAVKDAPLFEALCRVGDALRLRWDDGDRWLTFRSTGFFHDRLKEVPKRHLVRWRGERERGGKGLPVSSALEVAALTDAQLDAAHVAEGARVLYGIEEWGTVAAPSLRPHWRVLSLLPRGLQDAALASEEGVGVPQMPWEAQEAVARQFAPLGSPPPSLPDLLFRARFTPAPEPGRKASAQFSYRYRSAPEGQYAMLVSEGGQAVYSTIRPPGVGSNK